MDDSARPAFARALLAIGEVYSKKISAQQAELYWAILKGYAIEDIEAGAHLHMSDPDGGQYMPKPADIIRQIGGSGDTQAMLAWSKVERATRVVGSYSSVAFDDWKIHAVIRDMGGWIKLCETKVDDLPFRAREFEKRYRGYRTEQPYSHKCIGRSEAHNLPLGHHDEGDLPTMVGDQERARLLDPLQCWSQHTRQSSAESCVGIAYCF